MTWSIGRAVSFISSDPALLEHNMPFMVSIGLTTIYGEAKRHVDRRCHRRNVPADVKNRVGGRLAAPPSHTNVHTVPYTAVPVGSVCRPLCARSYLADSVHYLRSKPACSASAQGDQKSGAGFSDRFSPSSVRCGRLRRLLTPSAPTAGNASPCRA